MIGTRHIITERGGRTSSDEDRTGALDSPQKRPGLPDMQFQVLRCVLIHEVRGQSAKVRHLRTIEMNAGRNRRDFQIICGSRPSYPPLQLPNRTRHSNPEAFWSVSYTHLRAHETKA